MPRKIIGIVANHNPDEGRFWLNENYVKYFDTYGLVKLIDPLNDKVDTEIDLLVLPGGADISPMRYGIPHFEHVGMPNRAYEVFDFYMLPQYIQQGMPIFGICRGWQSLNVTAGGKLVPHIFDHSTSHPDRDGEPVHVLGNGLPKNHEDAFYCVGSSNHHQGVSEETLSPDYEPLLWAYKLETKKRKDKWVKEIGDKEDIVEAAKHKTLPIFCVQSHPEKNWCSHTGEPTCKEFDAYVRAQVDLILY